MKRKSDKLREINPTDGHGKSKSRKKRNSKQVPLFGTQTFRLITMADADNEVSAQERKKRRLEAWRKRQEEKAKQESSEPSKPKVTLSIGGTKVAKKKKTVKSKFLAFSQDDESEEEKKTSTVEILKFDDLDASDGKNKRRWGLDSGKEEDPSPTKKKRRWGTAEENEKEKKQDEKVPDQDDLDKFMLELTSGAMGHVIIPEDNKDGVVDVSGSMLRQRNPPNKTDVIKPVSGTSITPEELAKLMSSSKSSATNRRQEDSFYGPSDWETSASEVSLFFSNIIVLTVWINSNIIPFRIISIRLKRMTKKKKTQEGSFWKHCKRLLLALLKKMCQSRHNWPWKCSQKSIEEKEDYKN